MNHQVCVRGNSTDLQGTDLQGTDLQGADLQGTDLQGTDLQGTDLQGTDRFVIDRRIMGTGSQQVEKEFVVKRNSQTKQSNETVKYIRQIRSTPR